MHFNPNLLSRLSILYEEGYEQLGQPSDNDFLNTLLISGHRWLQNRNRILR
jgi:hypothetical protein